MLGVPSLHGGSSDGLSSAGSYFEVTFRLLHGLTQVRGGPGGLEKDHVVTHIPSGLGTYLPSLATALHKLNSATHPPKNNR